MILPTTLLDPRPAEIARIDPKQGSVNIPLAELVLRTHELPDKGRTIQVLGEGVETMRAVRLLESMGRHAEIWRGSLEPPSAVTYRLWEPNAFLEDQIGSLPTQRALDLGCGTGRNAVFLASMGYDVVAVDHLADALDRGRDLANRYLGSSGGEIEWIQMDLDHEVPLGSFDVVAMFFYCSKLVQSSLAGLLNPGGVAIAETFSHRNRELTGRPKDIARIADPTTIEGLRIAGCTEQELEGRHTIRLIANRF